MKEIFQTRLFFWKKQWKSLNFWLLFPLLTTITIVLMVDSVQEETKIPVGIVLQDDSSLGKQLYKSIETTPYIRPFLLEEKEALNKIEKHELDSVFIINRDYDKSIERGRRNNLIKGYQSDLSFAYSPLKELVISYVYGDFTRSQAAFAVRDLYQLYERSDPFLWLDLVEQSKTIEEEQNLLKTELIFAGTSGANQSNQSLVEPWAVWVLATCLATFLIFDWVIKEKKASLQIRFPFGKVSFKHYLMKNSIIYTLLLLAFDFFTLFTLALFFPMSLSISLLISMISYRITLNIFAFLVSQFFTSVNMFYMMSFVLFCFLSLGSGIIIPIDGLMTKYPLLNYLNPLQPALSIDMFNHWLVIACLMFIVWLFKKGEHHA